MTSRPPTRSRRFLKLAGMTASVATGFARNQLSSAFRGADTKAQLQELFAREAGLRIASTLGELKGAAMKLGQMMSTATDLLPPELAEALSGLQQHAPPMHADVVAEVIEAEFGTAPERLFASFDREPYAAASIGQVHRATTDDGREVVVKVQYPGIDGAIDSDLAQVRRAMRLAWVAVDRRMMDAMFDELSDRLHEELDYCHEADNLRALAAVHADDPLILIPEVIGERSSGRVLTLSYEAGTPLTEVATTWPQADRDRVGTQLMSLVIDELLVHGTLHGDPNPANFAFRPDGTLVLYDFGLIRRYSDTERQGFIDFVRAALAHDHAAMDAALIALHLRRPEHPPLDTDFYNLILAPIAPLLKDRPVNLGALAVNEQYLELAPRFIRYARAFAPGPEIAVVKRVVTGQFDALRALGAHVNVGGLLRSAVG